MLSPGSIRLSETLSACRKALKIVNQSSFIAAMLLLGFVLFLAAKGRLTAYTAVLWGASGAASGSTSSASAGGSGSPNIPNSLGGVAKAASSITGALKAGAALLEVLP